MTPKELFIKLQDKEDILLLDVREPYEYNICRFEKSLHVPVGQLVARLRELPVEQEMVVLCHHGIRSAMVVNYLQNIGFNKVYNLDGGIHLWATDVDPKMVQY